MKFLALLALCVGAHSWAGIGQVVESSGAAIIKRGGVSIGVTKSTPVEMNDRVETKSGRVRIKFVDDTVVTVTESSSLVIDDFVYSPSTGSGRLGIKAASGTVRYVSGRIAHSNPNAVKINTPTAAIAVRGTDFVMSVSETGASMIILMPTCEVEQNINLRGLTCSSGRIDVSSGGSVVTLDRPYQATMVSSIAEAPSAPVVVDLNGAPVNNNLMLSPPRTSSGASIVAAAKSAAEATGDRISNPEESRVKSMSSQDESAIAEREAAAKSAVDLSNKLQQSGIKITDVSNNESIYKIWYDGSETLQTGWGYERLSPSGYNYVNMALDMNTKALVVVTQDMITEAYNSNTGSSRSYGTIIINQQYR